MSTRLRYAVYSNANNKYAIGSRYGHLGYLIVAAISIGLLSILILYIISYMILKWKRDNNGEEYILRAPSRPTTPSTFTPIHTPSTISFMHSYNGPIGTPSTPREPSLRELVLERSLVDKEDRQMDKRSETKRVSWRSSQGERASHLPMIYENRAPSKLLRPTTLSLNK